MILFLTLLLGLACAFRPSVPLAGLALGISSGALPLPAGLLSFWSWPCVLCALIAATFIDFFGSKSDRSDSAKRPFACVCSIVSAAICGATVDSIANLEFLGFLGAMLGALSGLPLRSIAEREMQVREAPLPRTMPGDLLAVFLVLFVVAALS